MSITATSQVQKHFQLHTVYKRGKPFYDIEGVMEKEKYEQVYRRRPNKSIESLDTRVDSSFLNSVEIANMKLNYELTQAKKRYDDEKNMTIDETDQKLSSVGSVTMYSESSQTKMLKKQRSKIRAPDIGKMSARKGFSGKSPSYNNEDQFNNFTLSPRSPKVVNFALLSPRSRQRLLDEQNPEFTSKTIDTGRTHERNSFNETVMKCLFDLKKKDRYKNTARKAHSSLAQDPKQISIERVRFAEKHAQADKAVYLHSFYQTISRDTPSNMDYKGKKNNEFYFQSDEKRKSKLDFGTRKRKEDMEMMRLKEINSRKNYGDKREEMCDQKYFRREKQRDQGKRF